MSSQVKSWLDFGVRALIVVLVVYLVMVLFFKADYRRMDQMMVNMQGVVSGMEKQNQFLTQLNMNNNTDALYHMALEDEARGDIPSAIKKLGMAIQLSEYNAAQYKIKLEQIISQHK